MKSRNALLSSAALLSTLSAIGLAACHIEVDDPEKARSSIVEYEAHVDAASIALVALDGVNGTITVTARPDIDRIYVSAAAYALADTFPEAEAALDNLAVELAEIDGALEIQTIQPAIYDGHDYFVDYSILMPSYLVLDVVGINGEIVADGLESFVTLSLTNGAITAYASLPPYALADLSVVNGEVWLGVPATTSATVSALVVNGTIGLEGFDPTRFTGTGNSIAGVLGNGDAEIRLQAINGEVTLAAMP